MREFRESDGIEHQSGVLRLDSSQLERGLLVLISTFCLLFLFCAGYELLFQPEVVRIYISLLKESKTPAILEASAGAIQNLCAGRWTVKYLLENGFGDGKT